MKDTFERDVTASTKAHNAPLIAKGIRVPHPLDGVKPEDMTTTEAIEWNTNEATLRTNKAAHEAKVAAIEKKWQSDGEEATMNMCNDVVMKIGTKCPPPPPEKKEEKKEAKVEEGAEPAAEPPVEAAAIQIKKNKK
jgi:hypothetical protein